MFKKTQNKQVPLADRVTILESELRKTREMIRADMEKLIKLMRKDR